MTLRARAAPKVAVLIAVALLGARAIAQPSAPGKAPGATPAPDASRAAPVAAPDSPPATDPLASWTARLSRLDPARPREYFELAEEMADAAASRPEDRAAARQTAQRLCVLAFELWRGSQNRKDLATLEERTDGLIKRDLLGREWLAISDLNFERVSDADEAAQALCARVLG